MGKFEGRGCISSQSLAVHSFGGYFSKLLKKFLKLKTKSLDLDEGFLERGYIGKSDIKGKYVKPFLDISLISSLK